MFQLFPILILLLMQGAPQSGHAECELVARMLVGARLDREAVLQAVEKAHGAGSLSEHRSPSSTAFSLLRTALHMAFASETTPLAAPDVDVQPTPIKFGDPPPSASPPGLGNPLSPRDGPLRLS